MDEEKSSALGIKRLQALQEISVLLNSTLDTHEVLERALESAVGLLRAEASSVFLRDPVTEDLVFYAITGEKKAVLEGFRVPKGQGVVGWVVENRKPLLVPDANKDPRFFSTVDRKFGFQTHTLLCVPLITKGRVLGALEVVNCKDGGQFSEEDISFLETFGNHVATALDNALLYRELSEAHETLKTLDEIKSHVINVVSHELRTPTSLIQSFHELLKGEMLGALEPKQLEALERMEVGVKWLNRIITNVTNVALLDQRQAQLHLQSFDLAAMARDTVAEMAPLFEQRRQKSSTAGTANKVIVEADPDQIRHVLHNLLLNAIRFTPDEGGIRVILERLDGEVRVAVSENGIGIPETEFNRIFDQFLHAQRSATHSSGTIEFMSSGLGLGLAIAKRIVEMHRGRIWVESEVGKGSTFYFTLPR
ncbi:MAG: GAF domain-containing sensor histidine kinase, partial [Deltaproteobacteria bacterium]|nr:GAF domain-containing sensor histidine kinase [Deltaproteobacteria bacterium]